MPNCKVCKNPCLKRDGGNYLIQTYCSRFCYELNYQGLQKVEPTQITTSCVFCGKDMILNKYDRTINAWLCSNECNTQKSKAYGKKSHKKFLILLHLQLFGRQTGLQLAERLDNSVPNWRFNSHTISQLIKPFVFNGSVVQHKHKNPRRGSAYEIPHKLPLNTLGYT
jgi:hypothetical protein